jgi:hypothetical protein
LRTGRHCLFRPFCAPRSRLNPVVWLSPCQAAAGGGAGADQLRCSAQRLPAAGLWWVGGRCLGGRAVLSGGAGLCGVGWAAGTLERGACWGGACSPWRKRGMQPVLCWRGTPCWAAGITPLLTRSAHVNTAGCLPPARCSNAPVDALLPGFVVPGNPHDTVQLRFDRGLIEVGSCSGWGRGVCGTDCMRVSSGGRASMHAPLP